MVRHLRGSQSRRGLDRQRWERVRRQVFERDGYRCVKCGKAGKLAASRLEVDHRLRLRDGGAPLDLRNLQTLCRDCHISKTARENTKPNPEREAWAKLIREMMG